MATSTRELQVSGQHGVDCTHPFAIPAARSALTVALFPMRIFSLLNDAMQLVEALWIPPRKRHSILRVWNVVPGHTACSRLQLVTIIFNQIILAFSSTVLWYGTSQCFIEQQLVASILGATLSIFGCSLAGSYLRLPRAKIGPLNSKQGNEDKAQ